MPRLSEEISVYRYRNKINQKVYIGITKRLLERKQEHSRANKDMVFHKAVRKYGMDNFELTILCTVPTWEEACQKEQEFIKHHHALTHGYNTTHGGEGSYGRKGEDCVASKLSETTVQSIIADPCCDTDAAKKYGTTRRNVAVIREGKSWSHVDRSNAPEYQNNNHGTKLNEEIVKSIIFDSCSHREASGKYGVHKATVGDIRKGKSWKTVDRSNAPEYHKENRTLSEEDAIFIIKTPRTHREMAKMFGVSDSAIISVRNGKTWKTLDRSVAPKYENGNIKRKRDAQVR